MARHHDEAHVHWKHLAIYGAVMAIVISVGALVLWSFFEKQSMVVAPDPLPKITIVTRDAASPLAAAWVGLLTRAGLQATLVPIEKFNPIEGVVVFCDVPAVPETVVTSLRTFTQHGGSLAFVGLPPANAIGKLHLTAGQGMSDGAITLAEAPSPLLARINPGSEVPMQRSRIALLEESPQMVIDARWRDKARAAIMHMESEGVRYLWLGIDPDAMADKADRQLLLLLRTSFRWAAGQPVSEGAVGAVALAKSFTPDSRREARTARFTFGVDRLTNPRLFLLHMANRGSKPIENPSVMVWLPPHATQAVISGDFFMRRNVTLTGLWEEGACVISVPRLAPNEERVIKLEVATRRVAQ